VHSKLLIVDDAIALIGSANINDRSMVGYRDSELAVVIEDDFNISSKMAGVDHTAKRFAYSLRRNCWKRIFGFDHLYEVDDPLSVEMWRIIDMQTWRNEEIYREVFGCYPDNKITKMEEVDIFANNSNIQLYDQKHHLIKGLAINFPLNFLKNENLRTARNFEFGIFILPSHVFT